MKTISKKFNISKVLIFFSAILLFVSSLLLTQNQKQVYADVKHDQGYFRTVKDFGAVYNLDTIADGSQNIVSAFGYAGNRSANIVNKDYTSKSSASEFIFVADSCTDASPTNALVYQVIYLPDNYLYPAKNGVISATLSYNIGSPDYKQFWSSKYDTTPDENQITLASLTSRDFSAATSMSISDFAVDGENYAKDSVTSRDIISRTLNLPANKLTTNTLGLFFQSMYKGGGNNSMTMNSPKLTLQCLDNSAPEISFSKTRDGEYTNKRTITVTVKDSGGIKDVTLNNGTFIADRTIINETRSEATYVFEVSENGEYEVSATDYFGRKSTLEYIEDKIDKIAPEIIVINNLQSLYYTKQITIEAAFAYMGPSDEYFVYTLDGTEPNQHSPALVGGENTFIVTENGEQTLKVLSFDSAGNYNEVQEFSFYVDDNYYSVNVDCSEGVNVSQDGENLRYAEEYTFEYSIQEGYELYYIQVNGEKLEIEGATKTFIINGNLEIYVAARKIVSVSLNIVKYKYTGEDLSLDFEVTDANKEDVKFTYYLNDAETSFNAEGEYRVVYIVDTQNFVGTGEFLAWIVNKEIAVVTLNKTSYEYNAECFVLDFSANVDPSLIEFTYYKNQEEVTPKFVGQYVVQYSVNTETYEGSGTLEFEVVKKQIEIAVGSTEFVYNGQEVALEYANPVAANMTISFSQDGKGVSPINAGKYQYSITIVDDNYCGEKQGEITIARACVEIDVKECQYIYDKTEKQLNISVENDLQYTLEIYQGDQITQSVVNAGTYSYTITIDLPNYYSVQTGSFVVEKRNIKLIATSYTITYGDIMPELAYTIENDIKADGLTFEFEPVELKNEVSETTIKIKQKALDNYEVQYVDGIYKVNPKTLKVTILAGNYKTYGDADPELNFEINDSDIVGEDIVEVVVSREEGELVGTYAIENASTTNKNYTLEVVGSVFKIIKRKIVVKADSLTAVYGEAEKQLTYTITYGNLVFGDVLEGNLEREQGKNVGEFQISIGTLDNSNYEILFLSGKYNITPKPLKVIATGVSSIYGEDDAELIYTTEGLETNDALEGKLKREEGTEVGEYKILIGSLANSNYKIEFTSATYEIIKRTLNITAHNKTSVYGDEFVELTYDVDNFAYDDDFDFELVKQQGEQVGTYDITLKNIVLDNYDINFTKGIYSITKKQISLNVVAGQSKVYGEDDEVLLYAIDGVVGTLEGITIERASGEDAGFYDITLSYTDLANYEISECINGIFEIKKANVTITLNSKQFIYSGEALELEITEEWPVSYIYKQNGIEVESAINAGEYSVVAKFDGDKNHNAATSNTAILTITKKQIVISVENEFFMYDGKSKLPEYKTNVNCSCLVELYKKSNSEQVESAIMPGEYVYKIIVNNDNYCGEVSGTMVIAEKQVVVDGDGNEIVDTNGDLATNGVVVELVKIDNRDTINGINRNLTKKSTQSAYTFSVVGELPKNSVVNIKLNAKDLEDISKYTLYFYNENYELKEIAYKIQDGVFVFDVSDINLGIVLAKINEGLDILLLVAAALVVTIVVITASTAIKIYKFVRVKSVVNQAGIEEEIPFARKTKNKKVYKILKKLDDKDLKKHKKRKKLMLEELNNQSSNISEE